MHIVCPGCSTPYELPPHLLGPAGARVCCPACGVAFVLGPDGGLVAQRGARESDADAGSNGAAATQPVTVVPAATIAVEVSAPSGVTIAREVSATPSESPSLAALGALDDPPGTLAAAAAAGRLFADHGPALLDAFEALRRATPNEDVATEFRRALREIAGVDLGAVGVDAGQDWPPDHGVVDAR